MPLYEYLCDDCGQRTEALQRLTDPPLEVCPHCNGALKKLLSAPAFQFKGSGWYVTDYARSGGGAKGSEKSGRGDANAGAGKSEKSDKAEKSEKSESSAAPPAAAAPATTKPSSSE